MTDTCEKHCEATAFKIVIKNLEHEVAKLKGELESQEPVALPCCGYTDASAVKWNPLNGVVQCHNCGQTYTHPPQRTWAGLTTEETLDMFDLNNVYGSKWIEFARTVEAKLKEKNT